MEIATAARNAEGGGGLDKRFVPGAREDWIEGDWLSISLEQGVALGRIVLLRPTTSSVLVSFFSRRFVAVPSPAQRAALAPSEACVPLQCSDAPLRDGSWALLSGVDSYDREEWPLPWFSYCDHASRRYWLLRAPRGPHVDAQERIRRVTREEAEAYPANIVLHRRAAEDELEARLARLDGREGPM